jgi:hypothetical protein
MQHKKKLFKLFLKKKGELKQFNTSNSLSE